MFDITEEGLEEFTYSSAGQKSQPIKFDVYLLGLELWAAFKEYADAPEADQAKKIQEVLDKHGFPPMSGVSSMKFAHGVIESYNALQKKSDPTPPTASPASSPDVTAESMLPIGQPESAPPGTA